MRGIIIRLSKNFFITLFSIFLIGSLPAMFKDVHIDVSSYVTSIINIINDIFHPNNLKYAYNASGQLISRHLFPFIINPWLYSLSLLFASFVFALVISICLAYLTLQLPERFLKRIKVIFFVLESVPDILILGILQLIVIWFYKETHTLIFNIANYESKSITLPIIGLIIVPVILLYRGFVMEVEEEFKKPYVEFARSKGLRNNVILVRHIMRNHFIHIFSHSKFIIWFMLSNLLMVEYIFNIQGLLRVMLYFGDPEVLTISLLLLFLPIFLLFATGQVLIENLIGQEIE